MTHVQILQKRFCKTYTCTFKIFPIFRSSHALSIFSLQDKEPAGIIFAEDIHVQDVLQDLEEAQKDISKVCLYKLTHLVSNTHLFQTSMLRPFSTCSWLARACKIANSCLDSQTYRLPLQCCLLGQPVANAKMGLISKSD